MELRCTRVRVEPLDGGPARYGVLAEGDGGRSLLALTARDERELALQLDECGGVAGYLRRHGVSPLDPEGIAPAEGGASWIEP